LFRYLPNKSVFRPQSPAFAGVTLPVSALGNRNYLTSVRIIVNQITGIPNWNKFYTTDSEINIPDTQPDLANEHVQKN
jgi:hypothetical protein